jgi:hypothetical protein
MVRTETVFMKAMMSIFIISGGVFLIGGILSRDGDLGDTAIMVGWAIGFGSGLYSAAVSAINKLQKRIAELEKPGT